MLFYCDCYFCGGVSIFNELTTEIIATPTDSVNSVNDNFYSMNDLYLLCFAFFLLITAFLLKGMFRKMYVNLLGGRKGE